MKATSLTGVFLEYIYFLQQFQESLKACLISISQFLLVLFSFGFNTSSVI